MEQRKQTVRCVTGNSLCCYHGFILYVLCFVCYTLFYFNYIAIIIITTPILIYIFLKTILQGVFFVIFF